MSEFFVTGLQELRMVVVVAAAVGFLLKTFIVYPEPSSILNIPSMHTFTYLAHGQQTSLKNRKNLP